jgi:hypothetical protein
MYCVDFMVKKETGGQVAGTNLWWVHQQIAPSKRQQLRGEG